MDQANEIAGTAAEQLRRAYRPRPEPYPRDVAERLRATLEAYPDLFPLEDCRG